MAGAGGNRWDAGGVLWGVTAPRRNAVILAAAFLFAFLLAPSALADNELNVSSSTNGLVLADPDRNPDIIKVELRSFGSEFRYVVHQKKFGQGLETGGAGCRVEPKESGDQKTISCVRLFARVTAALGGRRLTDPAPNQFEVPASFPDPIIYNGVGDTADTVSGGLNADTIATGTGASPGETAADSVQGMGGNDNIATAGIATGSTADGGDGDDVVKGGPVLRGGLGNDHLMLDHATPGGSAIGGDGDDHIEGSFQADVLVGGEGNDRLEGEDGNDLLQPGPGSDMNFGDSGDDRYEMNAPSDAHGSDFVFLSGDTLDYHLSNAPLQIQGAAFAVNGAHGFVRAANQTAADELVTPATRIIGGHDDDVITDGEHAPGHPVHRFQGGPGDDTINAGDKADELFGGPGADILRAGEGDDLIDSVDGIEDTLACGPGLDFASLDLVDPDTSFSFGGKTPQVADVCEGVERANRKERPNVQLLTKRAQLANDRTFGVRLRCPASAGATCRGRLTAVLTPGGARAPHATLYAVRRGRSATVRVRLTVAEAARARGATAIVKSVQNGRFGPKTTTRLVALR